MVQTHTFHFDYAYLGLPFFSPREILTENRSGEISCKKGHTCTVAAATCTEYLQAITSKGGKCYGKKNSDTKGGRNKLSDSYYTGFPLKGAQS